MDGLDAASAGEAVAAARPDAIVHQMTAIAPVHAGKPDIKHFDKWFALTVRLRTEGTDHLLAAAPPAGPSSSRRATPAGTAPARAAGSRPRRTPWTRTRAAGRKADGGGPLPRERRRHRGRRRPAVRRAVRPGGDRRPGRASPKAAVPLIGDGGGYSSWIHLDWAESASRRRSCECAARRHARRPRRRPHRRHGSPSRASRPTPPRPVRRGTGARVMDTVRRRSRAPGPRPGSRRQAARARTAGPTVLRGWKARKLKPWTVSVLTRATSSSSPISTGPFLVQA
jgi:hypothetical protein